MPLCESCCREFCRGRPTSTSAAATSTAARTEARAAARPAGRTSQSGKNFAVRELRRPRPTDLSPSGLPSPPPILADQGIRPSGPRGQRAGYHAGAHRHSVSLGPIPTTALHVATSPPASTVEDHLSNRSALRPLPRPIPASPLALLPSRVPVTSNGM